MLTLHGGTPCLCPCCSAWEGTKEGNEENEEGNKAHTKATKPSHGSTQITFFVTVNSLSLRQCSVACLCLCLCLCLPAGVLVLVLALVVVGTARRDAIKLSRGPPVLEILPRTLLQIEK